MVLIEKPIDRLKSTEKYVSYNELSITDKLRFEAESRQIYERDRSSHFHTYQ